MTYRFDALYFDGVRSSPRPCVLEIRPDDLLISYPSSEGESQEFLIESTELRKSELSVHGKDEFSTLRFGSSGIRCLEVRTPGLRQALLTLPETSRPKGVRESRRTLGFIAALVTGLAAFIALSWLVLIPEIGDWLGNAMPKEWENQISRSLEDSLIKEYSLDESKTSILYEYAATVGIPEVENIRFYVCESAQTNAFAVMGNAIFVFTPMLSTVKSSDEFAALLFHEYAHIKFRHTSRATMRTLASYYLLSLLISDTSGIIAAVMSNLDTLQQLKYSRDFEKEADAHAALMLAERGLNPKALVTLLENLQKVTSDLPKTFEILSTHPDDKERINTLLALSAKYQVEKIPTNLSIGNHQALWEKLAQ